jgi:hypothetical protein
MYGGHLSDLTRNNHGFAVDLAREKIKPHADPASAAIHNDRFYA